MSKKSAAQTKVFISFGDVTGGFKSASSAAVPVSIPLPLYTGNDSELVVLSKKLMKKDGVTKLKAIQDLLEALSTRSERTLAEFLTFYVYAFSKLYVEDHRTIREKLCVIITTIVTTEKRLLAPHMKALIGPWWVLTGDPIEDVSQAAHSAFCSAIPPKKRQQVLVYLSSFILSEAVKNIHLEAGALCDLSIVSLEEAEERLERVIVSTLTSIEKFLAALTEEQNQQLTTATSGGGSSAEPVIAYRDLFTPAMWTKCLRSKFVLVRRAAFQLIATVALHIPQVLFDEDSPLCIYAPFCALLVNCLRVETNALNLSVLLSSFVTVLTQVPSFFSSSSVPRDIIPILFYLLGAHPQLALEYLLPVIGCFPAAHVALLDRQPNDAVAVVQRLESLRGLYDLLQQISDFAEQKGSEGCLQTVDSDRASGKAESGRRHGLRIAQQMQQQGTRVDCVLLGMQADVCVVELATLLLLRRSPGSPSTSTASGVATTENIQAVVAQLVQSVVITAQSSAIALRTDLALCKDNHLSKVICAEIQSEVGVGAVHVKEAARAALGAIGRSLLQLQRATQQEILITRDDWSQLLWVPLANGLLDLYTVTCSELTCQSDEDGVQSDTEMLTTMLNSASLADCIVQMMSSAWLEEVAVDASVSIRGAGIIGQKLFDLAVTGLVAGNNGAAKDALLSQLVATLSNPGVGLTVNGVVPSDAAALLSGDWMGALVVAVSGASPIRSGALRRTLSAAFVDLVVYVDHTKNIDSARNILAQCSRSNSLDCVSMLCRFSSVDSPFHSVWDPSIAAWALGVGTNFMLSSASVSTADVRAQVRFLVLVSAQPPCSCASVASEWFAVAKTLWCTSRGNMLADWFILSLVAIALKQGQNQRSSRAVSLPAVLLAAVSAWLSENPSALPDYLRRLFFARLRTLDTNHQSNHVDHMQFAMLSDVNVIMSWNDVQKVVLPILTPRLRLDLYSTISSTLNSSLTLADSAQEDADDSDMPLTTTGLHPKKWSRHVCALLSAQQSTAGVESIALFLPDFWRGCVESVLNGSSATEAWASQKRLTFALECVYQILDSSMVDPDGQIGKTLIRSHLINQPLLLFWTLVGAKQCSRVLPASNQALVSAAEGLLILLFSGVSSDLRALFFEEILPTSLDYTQGQHQLRDLRILSIKALLEKEFEAKPFPRDALRLQSANIRRDERPALGSPGQYLSWKPLSPDDPLVASHCGSHAADLSQLKKITPIACKVAAVHKEAGSDPYFTIAMDQTGDAQVAHELQVEWPKIIVGRNLPSSHVDLVWTYDPAGSDPVRNLRTTKFDSLVLETCVQWLESTLRAIADEVHRSVNVGEGNTSSILRHCAWYSDALSALCNHLLDAPSAVKEQFEVRVTARARGLVLSLLSSQCALPAYPARSTGLFLLRALLGTELGTGAGLWVPAAVSHVRLIASAIVSSTTTFDDVQVANIVSLTAAALAQILSVISHSTVAVDSAESFIPTALAALPSPNTQLASNMLLLLAAVWRHRSEARDGKTDTTHVVSDLAAWETEGFDFSVFVMVEGLTGQPERVRMDACSAVHFCLLKRSRKSCRDLMLPSLVSRFSNQLQKIAVCDPALQTSSQASDPSIVNALRITSCKVLDAFEASKGDSNSGSGSQSAEADIFGVTNDISLQEQERLEVEQDGRFLSELVGTVCSAELTRRLIVTEADASYGGEDTAGATEDGDDELGDGTGTPSTESQSNTRSTSRKVSKRAALQHLVKNDPLGSVLLWLLLLQSIDARAVEGWTVRARCVNYLKNTGMSSNMLFLLMRLSGDMLKFRDVSALLQRVETMQSMELEDDFAEGRPRKYAEQGNQNVTGSIPVGSLQHLAIYALFRTVCALPAMFRSFWSDDCTRIQKTRLSKFVEERVRESLMKREVALIAASGAAGRWDANEFAVRGSVVSGEVTAVLSKEETTVEIKVKLPPSYPLKNVEVACTSRIGVSDGRWRRWVLQIIQLLGMQDGSVVDAVLMWKCNIEKELEGVEPCPICYCTLHTKTLSLPSMACPTCNNKFHSPCLSTWFKSSGKSKCVICQQPFFN